ncbi:MAG TPA: acyl-CoA dehydrogenase family protein [Microvirga sp.]|nr:acyl-CoA dehydrogenase family protein [Microvirga sp.]
MTVIWQPALDPESKRWLAIAEQLADQHFAPLTEELDREQRYPWENVRRLVDNNLAGLFIPKNYGGQGASLTSTVAVVEGIGSRCSSTAAILCAYQLGAFPVLLAGREDQKQLYLGEMTKGNATSFALSERDAGSDASAITATATREGNGWRLKGEKYWIGNGGASRYYVVFAKTNPGAGGRGISAFMVDKEQEGAVIDELSDKMGIRGTQTSNLKLDVVVPDEARIGEVDRALRLAFQTLNVGRVMVAAQSLGLALAAYREASRRAVERKAFGQPIIENQGIGFKLADMAVEISAARMMLYEAAKAYDEGRDVANLGAMAKLYGSEVAHRAADAAVQIWAGFGYCKPCVAERLYRDQRVLEIYEGTSEVQRLVLARAVRKEVEDAAAAGQGETLRRSA